MKIDVEAAELLVLNSAIETLKQGRIETMIIEFHSRGNYIHIIKLLRVKILNNFKRATPNR